MTPYPANAEPFAPCLLCGAGTNPLLGNETNELIHIGGRTFSVSIEVSGDNLNHNINDDPICNKCFGIICSEFMVNHLLHFNVDHAIKLIAAKRLKGEKIWRPQGA